MVVELRVSSLSCEWGAGNLLFAHSRPLGSRLASVASVPIGSSLPLSWGWRIWVQSGHCPLFHVKIPPPHFPPPHRHHHHESDALDVLDVLAKTPCLYQVPDLRYPCHCCRPCCCCRPSCCPLPPPRPPHRCHHHEAHALNVLDVFAKTPGLYLVPELRYPWYGMVWYGMV